MKGRGWLAKKLRRKKKKIREYQVEVHPEQIEKIMPESFTKQFYELKGKHERDQKTIAELKQIIDKLKRETEEEEKKIAFEQERILDKKKRENQFPIYFRNTKPLYIVAALSGNEFFRDMEGKVWKQWCGLLFEKNNGNLGFRFLLTNPNEQKIVWLPAQPIPIQYFPYILPETIITDAKIGRIPINMTVDGDWAPPELTIARSQIEELKKKNLGGLGEVFKIDINTILKNADEDTKNAFFFLYDQLNSYIGNYREALERNRRLLMEKLQSDITSEASNKAIEEQISTMESLINKLENMGSRLAPTVASEQEARLTATAMEATMSSLYETLKKIKMQIETPEGIKDKARKDIVEELSLLMPQVEAAIKETKKEGGKGAVAE